MYIHIFVPLQKGAVFYTTDSFIILYYLSVSQYTGLSDFSLDL